MKERIMDSLRRLAKALLVPVYILPVVGVLIALANLVTNARLLELFPVLNHPVLTGFGTILSSALVFLVNHLGLIFGVGTAIGLAHKKQAETGFAAVLAYIVFIYAMHAFLSLSDLLAAPEAARASGQAVVLGVQVLEMGIFPGILIGMLTAFIYNRFAEIRFAKAFQIYGGARFALILLLPLVVLLAVLMSHGWPVVQSGMHSLGGWIDQSGNFGLLLYGMAERLLIPTGLQSLIYVPFLYTSLGGAQEVSGQVFAGARTIYLAEMADPSVRVLSETVLWDARGISKMFGLVGACLAMYHTAKPENKAKTRAVLLPAALVSFVAGVTEPIEFSFLFVAPVLFVLHAVLSGLSMVALNALNVRAIAPNGFLDFFIYNFPMGVEKTRWPFFILIGLVFFWLYYILFRLLITRFDLQTIGREENNQKLPLYSKADDQTKSPMPAASERNLITKMVSALGGKENIATVDSCYSRLRLTVQHPEKIDEAKLKNETGASGIIIKGQNVQIVYGLEVDRIRRLLESYLDKVSDS